jgi:hypothetical protein
MYHNKRSFWVDLRLNIDRLFAFLGLTCRVGGVGRGGWGGRGGLFGAIRAWMVGCPEVI